VSSRWTKQVRGTFAGEDEYGIHIQTAIGFAETRARPRVARKDAFKTRPEACHAVCCKLLIDQTTKVVSCKAQSLISALIAIEQEFHPIPLPLRPA